MTPNDRDGASWQCVWCPKTSSPEQKMKLNILVPPALTVLVIGTTIIGKLTAAPVAVPDFSFENTAITPGGTTAAPNVGTNWTASGNGGCYLQDITNTLFTPT